MCVGEYGGMWEDVGGCGRICVYVGGEGVNLVVWFPREAGIAPVVHNHTGRLHPQTIYSDLTQLGIHCPIIAGPLHGASQNTLNSVTW